jgi:hypothetical protein
VNNPEHTFGAGRPIVTLASALLTVSTVKCQDERKYFSMS